MAPDKAEPLGLKEQLENTLAGATLILPGIQALFGFQFIAIFQPTYQKDLTAAERTMHFVAIVLSSVAIVLTVAPAALHRRAEPERASERLIRTAGRLLSWGLWALAFDACLDFRVLASLVYKDQPGLAWAIALGILALYVGLWKGLPAVFKLGKGETEKPESDEQSAGG